VAYAAKAVKEAKDALKKAKDDYDKYKDNLEKAKDDLAKGLIDKDDYESMKDDGKYYLANIAMSTENVVAKTAALLQATASASASAGTYGFSADIQLQIDGSYEKTQSKDITSKGSSINAGGNFTVTAGNKAKIEGSDVSAGGDIILDAKSVEILAAENTSTSSTKSGNISTTISIGTASVGGPSVNGSASFTESGSSSTTYTNSHLSGSNITIKSTEDTTVRGGVVTADNKLSLEVGGDLTVESVQDRSKNHSNTVGVSAGGGDGGLSSGGANANISSGNKKWVTEQTSLTGGIVDIYVENKTTLHGAVIASTTGDLTLDTGSLEFSDIKDKDRSNNLGGGVNASSSNGNMTGSVNATYGFTDLRQTNFATIGEGTITVRDAAEGTTGTEGLNRDVSISQYNTKDGGLQGGFTVDAAIVNFITNPDGTVRDTAKAVEKGSMIVYSITEGVVKATAVGIGVGEGNGDGLGVMGTLEAVTNARKDVLTIVALAENKGLAEKIDGALEGDAARLEGALNEASGIIQTSDGVAEGDISKVNLYQGSETDNAMGGYAAAYDQNGKEIYFNTQGTDISKGGDIITSLFWEAQRKDNTTNGLDLNYDQQTTLASSRGEQAGNLWNRFSETANTSSNVGGVINWNNANAGSSTLVNGSNKANSLDTALGNGVVPRTIWLEGAGPQSNSEIYSMSIINKMAEQGIKHPEWLDFGHEEGLLDQAGRTLNALNNRIPQSEIDAIKDTYDRGDGQYNLVGYSLGSVRAGIAAQELANEGNVIDNLVLIASPLEREGDLYKSLLNNPNIKKVIIIDVKNDFLANEQGNIDLTGGVNYLLNGGDHKKMPHFYYTTNDEGQQDSLVKQLKDEGLK
jgi:hypothetical protein